jgi:hypothetical protein
VISRVLYKQTKGTVTKPLQVGAVSNGGLAWTAFLRRLRPREGTELLRSPPPLERRDPLPLYSLAFSLFLIAAFFAAAPKVFGQAVTVTLEQPKVQQSSLFTNPAAFGATSLVSLNSL